MQPRVSASRQPRERRVAVTRQIFWSNVGKNFAGSKLLATGSHDPKVRVFALEVQAAPGLLSIISGATCLVFSVRSLAGSKPLDSGSQDPRV